MHQFVKALYAEMQAVADFERKRGAEAYMRNQFVFLGIDTVTRRNIFKNFISASGLPLYADLKLIIDQCENLEREMHYCAIELAAKYKNQWDYCFVEMIEVCILANSWWDTVDATASLLSGPYFKKFPQKIKSVTNRWNRSENIWLQRSSLLFQLKYKDATDLALLSKYIKNLSASNEFFVQKAIGWMLREYAKTDAGWVTEFVATVTLKPLSRREAMKAISL